MTTLVFVDTETTSLRPDRRIWEIGLITRNPEGTRDDRPWQAFIQSADLDLAGADRKALSVGGFYERHPEYSGYAAGHCLEEAAALSWVEAITRGAILVGHNVAFDAEGLATRMRANGFCPSWNYHLLEISSYAAGHLRGAGMPGYLTTPPWSLDEVARAVGVRSDADARHTAVGDAKLVMDVWDTLHANDPVVVNMQTLEQDTSSVLGQVGR